MSQRRFYVSRDLLRAGVATLPQELAHRVRNVLRLRNGDEVELFDGAGASYAGTIEILRGSVRVGDLKPLPRATPTPVLVLAIAMIKTARFEWMLEKATELGVDEFIPLVTHYTDVRGSELDPRAKKERWLRIVHQACEQCGRSTVPPIRKSLAFSDFLVLREFSRFTRILCYEKALATRPAEMPMGPCVVCIGPEGGWAPEEIETAARNGYRLVSLGGNILRVETAALAAVTLIRNAGSGFRFSD